MKALNLAALRHVSWAGLEAVSSVLVSFAAMLGIARLIGASEFGLGALAIGITQIVSVVIGSLFHDALVRNPHLSKRQFDSAWTATLLLSAIALLACFILSEPLSWFFHEPRFAVVFSVMAVTLVPDGATATLTAERRRELDFRLVTVQFLIGRMVGALSGVAAAISGLGVWSMIIQQWVTVLLGLLILFLKSPYRPKLTLVVADLLPMFRFTSSIIATQFVIQLAQRLMLVYVARIGDLALAGYWGLADRLVDAIQQTITNAVYHVSLSHFSKVQQEPVRLGEWVRLANAWLSSLVFPGLVLIACTGSEIVNILMGDGWKPAGLAVQVLVIGVIVQLRRLMDHVALNALGRSEVALLAYSLETALALLALIVITPTTLFEIGIVRAAQPLAGFSLIVLLAIKKTERSLAVESVEIARDILLALMVGAFLYCLFWYVGGTLNPLQLVITSSAMTMVAAVASIGIFRPSILFLAWSLISLRGGRT